LNKQTIKVNNIKKEGNIFVFSSDNAQFSIPLEVLEAYFQATGFTLSEVE